MSGRKDLKVPKWPFVLGDALLLVVAGFVVYRGHGPMTLWEGVLCACAVALGGYFGIMPFVLEHRAAVKLAEADSLATTVAQINKLKSVANQISGATAQWQNVHEASGRTVATAKEITDRIKAEAEAFTEFLKKANDSEKATLRLEAEKLRRTEKEWMQVAVRMLDHIFALHQAAVRSGQPKMVEQLGNFQNACRDAARRIGLVPFAVATDESFDGARHQLMDAQTAPPGARVAETIATGYTFQGQLLRPALVRLQADGAEGEPGAVADAGKSAIPGESYVEQS